MIGDSLPHISMNHIIIILQSEIYLINDLNDPLCASYIMLLIEIFLPYFLGLNIINEPFAQKPLFMTAPTGYLQQFFGR